MIDDLLMIDWCLNYWWMVINDWLRIDGWMIDGWLIYDWLIHDWLKIIRWFMIDLWLMSLNLFLAALSSSRSLVWKNSAAICIVKIYFLKISYIRKGKHSPAAPTYVYICMPHSDYPPWILKRVGLESSGQRLISLNHIIREKNIFLINFMAKKLNKLNFTKITNENQKWSTIGQNKDLIQRNKTNKI